MNEPATLNQRRALFNMYSALKIGFKDPRFLAIRNMSKAEASVKIALLKAQFEQKELPEIEENYELTN